MLNNQSLNFGEDESLHIQNPVYNPNGNFNAIKSNGFKNTQPQISAKYINVLDPHPTSGKLLVNPQFQNYMSSDASNSNVINVSFMGAKHVGKSFLLDNILSLESGQVRRLMSKSQKQLLNMPNLISYTHGGDRVIYLDNNGDPSPSIFLWLYFLSSVMVYSLTPNNNIQQTTLLQCLVFVHNNLQPQFNDEIRPQLVLVRRDSARKDAFDIQLIRKIQQLQLFQPEIIVLYMPYPGLNGVMAKQLLDVPIRQLDQNYFNEVTKLHQVIRSAKPKKINGNMINSQNFRLAVQPLTKSLNNQQNISTKRIWNQVNEALSINFYNQYLKSYSEQLQREFANEEPYDKYSIYKKLNRIKKRTNKKMQKYNTISNEPIFRKYQQKLNQIIKNKETLVRNVNQSKSRQIHQQNYNNLFENVNPSNCGQLIDLYCKTKLDDQKTQVLLENFQKIMKSKSVPISIPQVTAPNPVKILKKRASGELITINNQLKQLERQLIQKSNFSVGKNTNLDIFKTSISNKRAQLQALKSEYQNLANQPHLLTSGENKNQELAQLQSERERLNNHINDYDRQIQALQRQKENHLKQSSMKLQEELRQQQNELRNLQTKTSQQAVYRSKINEAGKSTKKTCCNIM